MIGEIGLFSLAHGRDGCCFYIISTCFAGLDVDNWVCVKMISNEIVILGPFRVHGRDDGCLFYIMTAIIA